MFLGEFSHALDEKNRVVIPAKFRTFITDPQDREGFFILVNPNKEVRCLRLYTMSRWKKVMESIKAEAAKSQDSAAVLRYFAARGEFAPMDSQSRIVIPPKLLEQAGLKKDLVLVGIGDWIEIWNVEEYAAAMSQAQGVDVKKFDNILTNS